MNEKKILLEAAHTIKTRRSEEFVHVIAACILANHILATVHEDDDEPLTEEWLILHAGLCDDNAYTLTSGSDSIDVTLIKQSAKEWSATWGDFENNCDGEWPVYIKTRGQFRDLCRVLGITLSKTEEKS